MKIGQRIKERRLELGYTVDQLAELLNKNRATVYRYENGDIEHLPHTILQPIAKALDTTPGYLITGQKEDTAEEPAPKRKGIAIPVLGHVAAGIPIEMIEDIIDTEEIPEDMARHGEFFALKIKGDSMTPSINNSDVVIVRQQEDAENGDIVIATVNGNDAVCKRLKKYSDGISLISLNPAYEPLYFNTSEIQETPVKIIGKVVELRRKF